MSDAFPVSPVRLVIGALILRALSTEDSSDVYAYASDPEVARFTLWPPPPSEDAARKFVEGLCGPNVLSWAVTSRVEPRVFGMVFLHSFHRRHQKAEIAFNIARQQWARGIATAAASAVVRFAFESLKLKRVEATCMPGNIGSRRVLEKLGMSNEGLMRRSHYRHDGFHDMLLYAIVRNA